MRKNVILWIVAFIITIISAIYQRVTGPTYPISGKVQLENNNINYKLARSSGGIEDHEVLIEVDDPNIKGSIFFKRYKTADKWKEVPMEFVGGNLKGYLPHQPPAGKLEYYLKIWKGNIERKFPQDNSVVIRFKGAVPLTILIPHIFAMFLSMLLSTRTGLEYFNDGKNLKKLILWTISLLFLGGFVFGPITQKFAFGELWTGFPFGFDLTDNKTLIAMIGWLLALYMYYKSKNPKWWAVFASIVLLSVYLIPHSVLGSELDYNKIDKEKSQIEKVIN